MDPLTDDVSELPPVRVTPYPDGPLVIRGDFVISDVCGNEIPSGKAVALCRCGRSARKPFCDGTHQLGARVALRDTDRQTDDD